MISSQLISYVKVKIEKSKIAVCVHMWCGCSCCVASEIHGDVMGAGTAGSALHQPTQGLYVVTITA